VLTATPQVSLPARQSTRYVVQRLSASAYLDAPIEGRSFLQLPSWAKVKPGWESDTLGWIDSSGRIVGTALVLYRRLPGVGRSFAYVPEGPVIDWSDPQLSRWLDPFLDHVAAAGAFAVRIGPPPMLRRWQAQTLKEAAGPGMRIGDVLADRVEPLGHAVFERLSILGWRRREGGRLEGGDAQPRFHFRVPLRGRSLDDVWTGFNQEWRRNIKKATRSGVSIELGSAADLPTFYQLLTLTEERNGFRLNRSLAYYQRQYEALNSEYPGRMRLYLARHDDEVLAAHTMNVVGNRVWYQTGASANHRRDVKPSNALQWRMMQIAYELGADVYDMRGVKDDLGPESRDFGLLRWKLGTGGEVAETLGEWELTLPGPVNHSLHRAMRAYQAHRAKPRAQ
jgi:lipid II:glycine glycyltransferase (peptidoglycan interpeptide bridge formation enzyme)